MAAVIPRLAAGIGNPNRQLMRTLITGGAGFIGTHLANRLQSMGWLVRVLDDLSSGNPDGLHEQIFLQRGDVNDIPQLWTLLQGVEVVFHLAARVSVPASAHYPGEYNTVNVGGTVSLLEASRDVGVKRVILASSATVYGALPTQPVSEDVTLRPAAPYAVSKVAAEHYLLSLARINHFEAVALRIFNAYGPQQPAPPVNAPVIPRFMQDVLHRRSVLIFGDGTQTRDFIYVDDVVDGLVAAAIKPNLSGEIINIGSGVGTSINDLAATVGQAVGQTPSLLHNLQLEGGVPQLVADISKAQAVLDFRPQVDLDAGLEQTFRLDPKFRTA